MDIEGARQYLGDHHRAVLATRRGDGGVQQSPVAVAVDDAGRAVISSRETAYKVRNLRREPRAWLCVVDDRWYGEWIQVEGPTTIVSLPEAMEPLVDYYRRISGEHPDWEDYRQAMEREQRVVIRIDIDRAGPNLSG